MLPRISRTDLGHPNEPGEYGFGGALVMVDHHHREIWRDQPDAVFSTILLNRVGDNTVRLALGSVPTAG